MRAWLASKLASPEPSQASSLPKSSSSSPTNHSKCPRLFQHKLLTPEALFTTLKTRCCSQSFCNLANNKISPEALFSLRNSFVHNNNQKEYLLQLLLSLKSSSTQNYALPIPQVGSLALCRTAFQNAYGISSSFVDCLLKVIKDSPSYVFPFHHTTSHFVDRRKESSLVAAGILSNLVSSLASPHHDGSMVLPYGMTMVDLNNEVFGAMKQEHPELLPPSLHALDTMRRQQHPLLKVAPDHSMGVCIICRKASDLRKKGFRDNFELSRFNKVMEAHEKTHKSERSHVDQIYERAICDSSSVCFFPTSLLLFSLYVLTVFSLFL
jgi:hypothetical protein